MWRLLVTHSILLFPLHFSRASLCAITFQLESIIATEQSTKLGMTVKAEVTYECGKLKKNPKHISLNLIGTGCELSHCDMRAAGCAFAWRSHLTNLFFVLHSDVTSGDGLTSRFLTHSRHVFTSRPQPKDIYTSKYQEFSTEFINHTRSMHQFLALHKNIQTFVLQSVRNYKLRQ
jgi:hypothetical protein